MGWGRRRTGTAALGSLVAGALGAAVMAVPSAPADGAVDHVDTSRLLKAVTVSGILAHERALQTAADAHNGTRASGTPGHEDSARYVAQTLRAAGYRISRQRFTVPLFQQLEQPFAAQAGPDPQEYPTGPFDYSGSGYVFGPVVPTKDIVVPAADEPNTSSSGCEPSDFKRAPDEQSIALIQRGTCSFEDKANNAVRRGYAAAMIFNEGQPGRQEVLTSTLSNPSTIPVVGLSYADGSSLYAQTRSGPVTGEVFTSTRYDPAAPTFNLFADSPPGAHKGERVIVSAHLDSVSAGPGINDNGSGVSTIVETARQLSRLGYLDKLQRPVRFAFWGGEEEGLVGSQHYVDSLSVEQRAKIYATLDFDMLASPNYIRYVYDGDGSAGGPVGPAGSGEIEKIFTDHFAGLGLASEPREFNGRSDYGPFIAVGIPSGGLFAGGDGTKTEVQAAVYGGTAGEYFDACYHLACDTIGNLNTQALYELGDAAADAIAVLALSRSGLYPDGSVAPPRPTVPAPTAVAPSPPAS